MAENVSHWPWPVSIRDIHKGKRFWDAERDRRLAGEVAASTAFREALAQDGFAISKTYGHEPVEHAFTAEREGIRFMGLARPGQDEGRSPRLPTGSISGWGADGIGLTPLPIEYPGFDALKAMERHCPECGADDVETVRVAFANRACLQCAPELRKQLERPGWCD